VAQIAEDQAIAQSEIEIGFADEARIGQKNKITRRVTAPGEWYAGLAKPFFNPPA
jgi:hypothetical protein